ncbi:MAG: VOC family protein [Devosia sp.]|nr:VOC family protein [Devosia sp.]
MAVRNAVHTGYHVADIDRSVDFYKALGFQEYVRMPMGDARQRQIGTVVFMALPGDGPRLELQQVFDNPPPRVGTARSHIGLTIDDMDETLHELAALGIRPEAPPFSPVKDGATICFLADPDGHLVELLANLTL